MPDLPVTVTQAGAQLTPPADLLKKLIANVSAKVPGYTANLPPALIADLAGTATGAIALIDSAMVDLINSVSPYGANIPMLNQLGQIYGVSQGVGSNTSVPMSFMGPAGFVVPKGFIVSDGNHQYVVQKNNIIPEDGQSDLVYCVANAAGSWAVPAGSVKTIVTSLPKEITVTCTNINAGLPGLAAQPRGEFRGQVMQAGMFAVQGTPDCLKAALAKVNGVQPNLISYRQVSLGKWAVIVGGGDPYEVAQAIFEAIPDISVLTADVNDPSGAIPVSQKVTINDYPDTYNIPFIIPTSQMLTVILTWNTSEMNFVDPASVAALAVPAIVDYINGIYVGQPVNTYQLQSVFQAAVSSILNVAQISLIKLIIGIDGVVVPADPNTGLVSGDRYKYFTTDASHVSVQKYDGTN